MPTYDYVCAACGHAFEHFQDMSAKKLRTCPRCKKPKLERQVGTGAGLIFKGSGFYITDYRKPGTDSSPPPAAEPAKKPDAGATGTTAPTKAPSAEAPKAAPAGSSSTSKEQGPPTPPAPGKGSKSKQR